MKTKMLSTLLIMFMAITGVFAMEDKKEELMVAGECGMCKARIEKVVKTVDGVTEATWDVETKMLEVSYSSTKLDMAAVHKAIAGAGHDTKLEKADDEVYNALPACCKYERLECCEKK